MYTKKAILITGKAGVGKSTLAKYIHRYYLYGFKSGKENHRPIIIPMAQELKNIAIDCFEWDGKKDFKGRRLLQVLGTEAGRAYNEDIWVNKVLDNFFMLESFDILISDDVRFRNEIEVCKSQMPNVIVIKVEGPQRVELPKHAKEHPSEHGLDDFDNYDFIVYNIKTKDYLEQSAKYIVETIEKEESIYE